MGRGELLSLLSLSFLLLASSPSEPTTSCTFKCEVDVFFTDGLSMGGGLVREGDGLFDVPPDVDAGGEMTEESCPGDMGDESPNEAGGSVFSWSYSF